MTLSETTSKEVNQTEIQPIWGEVQTCLEDLINTYVPSKVVKRNRPPPWFKKKLKDKFANNDQAIKGVGY